MKEDRQEFKKGTEEYESTRKQRKKETNQELNKVQEMQRVEAKTMEKQVPLKDLQKQQ